MTDVPPQANQPAMELNNLNHFQSRSRLHFIGSWINEATGMIRKLFEEHPEYDHSAFFNEQNIVCHVDMDCFFVLVALSKPENAHLRDKPVAVASGGAHSEVSSCSYKAREFGVRAGMWLMDAKRLCPDLTLVPYDFDRVRVINQQIYKTAFELCPPGVHMKLQVLSVDEFLVAFDTKNFARAEQYCEALRGRIAHDSNGCTASCGIAPNVPVARAVTALAKPNGVRVVRAEEVSKFVQSMAVDSIHGVGRVMKNKINELVKSESELPLRRNREDESGRQQPQEEYHRFLPDGRRTEFGEKQIHKPKPKENTSLFDESENEDENEDDEIDEDEELSGEERQDKRRLVGELQLQQQLQQEAAQQKQKRQVTMAELLSIPIDKMRRHLGTAMGDKLFNLAHNGVDHTLVVGTGTQHDSAALPKAVATSMNYAVRLSSMHEFASLLLQLCKDVSQKLDRVGAAAMILKLTVYVRHPDAPVNPPKHLGCGHCFERVIGSAKSPSAENAWCAPDKMHDLLMPLAMKHIVVAPVSNAIAAAQSGELKRTDSNESQKQQQQQQQDSNNMEGNDQQPPKLLRKDSSSSSIAPIDGGPIPIHELRGITLHASSIVPQKKLSKAGSGGKQQISLTAAFRMATAAKQQQQQQSSAANSSSSWSSATRLGGANNNNNNNNSSGLVEHQSVVIDDDDDDDVVEDDSRSCPPKSRSVTGKPLPNSHQKLHQQKVKQHQVEASKSAARQQETNSFGGLDDLREGSSSVVICSRSQPMNENSQQQQSQNSPKGKRNMAAANTSDVIAEPSQIQVLSATPPELFVRGGGAALLKNKNAMAAANKSRVNNSDGDVDVVHVLMTAADNDSAQSNSKPAPPAQDQHPLDHLAAVCQAIREGKIATLLNDNRSVSEELRRVAASVVLSEAAMPLILPVMGCKVAFSDELLETARRIASNSLS